MKIFTTLSLLCLMACSAQGVEFPHDPIERLYDPHVIIKRGETFFDQEAYTQARREYLYFLELFPVHQLGPFVKYRIGLTYATQFQGPDRDPTPIIKAREWFAGIVRDYPGSPFAKDSAEQIAACDEHLAAVHAFVGRFYLRRGSYRAAAARFETILFRYPETRATSEAWDALEIIYQP